MSRVPTERTVRLSRDFAAARQDRRVQMNCIERETEFIDYPKRPEPEEAEELCSGCPILKLCGDYAKHVQKPTHGVWGGKVWVVSPVDMTRGIMLQKTVSRAA